MGPDGANIPGQNKPIYYRCD